MSETVVLVVGVIVFALTVWGSVMAGGITLSRRIDLERDFARRATAVED
jgi:hypothetical protein